ncbi:MAG: nucleotidyltransferase domain-containing protein, partial [Methanocorpusculum sp.]|nr:nucleotidyltransferase domain-containing protein [Methanocorpusculum sp.]
EANLPEIRERFGIETIGIFGSVARGEDTADSDVDVIYTFREGESTLNNLVSLVDYMKNLFGREMDLVSSKWMSTILTVS